MPPAKKPTPPESTKLRCNTDDGTAIVPVIGGENPHDIVLREPTIGELAELYNAILEADDEVAAVVENRGDNDLRTPNERVREQDLLRRDPERSPHGRVLLKIVAMLGGEEPNLADLPSWATGGDALLRLQTHWSSPLPGQEVEQLLEAARRIASAVGSQGNGFQQPARLPR